jgi:hypothetical protein
MFYKPVFDLKAVETFIPIGTPQDGGKRSSAIRAVGSQWSMKQKGPLRRIVTRF